MKKLLLLNFIFFNALAGHMRIMLCPAGDAINPGRAPQDLMQSHERGLTRQLAQAITEELEGSDITCIMSHKPGETLSTLQLANMANQLNVDLCISLHVATQARPKPTLYTYYYVQSPLRDKMELGTDNVLPIHQAQRASMYTTTAYAHTLLTHLTGPSYTKLFNAKPAQGIPIMPLLAITRPALCIELGLQKDDDWKNLLKPLCDALRLLK
jgi:N-acetylmuramoyl-L-alanine amidase